MANSIGGPEVNGFLTGGAQDFLKVKVQLGGY